MLKLLIPSPRYTIVVLLLIGLQLLRDPTVPTDYLSVFYRNQTQIWEGNGYIALQGLGAPPIQEDFYAHGREQILARFIRNQQLKQKLGVSIPPTYPVPMTSIKAAEVVPPGEEMLPTALIKDSERFDLPCRYIWPEEKTKNKHCLSSQQLRANIEAHTVLWERFNTLPDYKVFSVVPIGIKDFFSDTDLLQLSRWKTTEILEEAANGEPEHAFEEWMRFMTLYRAMLASADSAVKKAVYMVVEKNHRQSFGKLLYHHPALSVHIDAIEQRFPALGIELYSAETILSDDWAQVEETMLNSYGLYAKERGWQPMKAILPTGDLRNKIYNCQKETVAYLDKRPASAFLEEDFTASCNKWFNKDEDFLQTALLMAGNPISNVTYIMLVHGVLKSRELVQNMYIADLEWRMALAGTYIMNERPPEERLQDYIAKVDGFDSKIPLRWDRQKNRLFFKDMNGTERSFYLPSL